ncbi:MAG: nucleotide exchange factor GrpE [Candidatus Puniceispirillales bacterium]
MINDTPEENPQQDSNANSDGQTPDEKASDENPASDNKADQDINLNIEDILDPLSTLQAERDELKDQMLRAVAETENTRRRAERDVAQARKYGHTSFARDLLSVVENLSRAVEALPEQRDDLDETMKNLVIGVEMISREMTNVLERHGITRIMPMGEKFDPNKHQAMFEVPTNDAEPGMIVQVAQSGWMLHDRLLSPAMVGVAKAMETTSGDEQEADKNNESNE